MISHASSSHCSPADFSWNESNSSRLKYPLLSRSQRSKISARASLQKKKKQLTLVFPLTLNKCDLSYLKVITKSLREKPSIISQHQRRHIFTPRWHSTEINCFNHNWVLLISPSVPKEQFYKLIVLIEASSCCRPIAQVSSLTRPLDKQIKRQCQAHLRLPYNQKWLTPR